MSEQWYYGQNGVQKGPVDSDVIRQLVASGQVRPEDLVWKEGMANWVPASTIGEFFAPGASATYVPPVAQPEQGFPAGQAPTSTSTPSGLTPPVGYAPVPQQNTGKATTAMVLGICSIPLCMCPLVGIGLGIAAIIVGSQVKDAPNQSQATAGKICGIVGLVLSGLNSVAGIVMRFS